jgi:hypothetical protein
MTHKCAIAVCEDQIDPKRLCCKGHWYMAPGELRQAVLTAWKSLQGNQARRTPEEYARRRKVYEEARDRLVQHVEQALLEGKEAVRPGKAGAPVS